MRKLIAERKATPGVSGALICTFCVLLSLCFQVAAAEVMPPAPAKYFNDYANTTRPDTAARLNQALEQFEKDTSSQIVVAVFPKMQTDSSIEDYVHRMFEAWKIGQKDRNNGALLAVFIQDRKMRIEVGYGLEGAIPDAISKRIISDEITPQFRSGNYEAGLAAGVTALMQAARGEYKGTGRTAAQSRGRTSPWPFIIFFVLFFFVAVSSLRRRRRGTIYGGRSGWGPVIWGGGGGGWGGGGGGWSSGGGGFSGGGGSSGGGGASGSW